MYVTDGSVVLCAPAGSCLAHLAPCSPMKVTIRTVDTDEMVATLNQFSV